MNITLKLPLGILCSEIPCWHQKNTNSRYRYPVSSFGVVLLPKPCIIWLPNILLWTYMMKVMSKTCHAH